jgi:beta-lactamase regulating signal transducer with metallopeptidase domain
MPALSFLPTQAVYSVLGWAAETTVVAALVALVALLVARLKPLGAASRHALWLVVLLKLMTPPLVQWPWSVHWAVPQPVAAAAPLGQSLSRGHDVAPVETDASPGVASEQPMPVKDRAYAAWPDLAAQGRVAIGRFPHWLLGSWLIGSTAVGAARLWRIARFRRLVRDSMPAPEWLRAEASRLSDRLGIRVPELRVSARVGTPLLWCAGRPLLMVPIELVKLLQHDRWTGVLTHELAHLRRGDHWVSRLELAADCVWWWNPLYWLARRRLDAEAEMACDAWVVWTAPDDRLTYAETLVRICSALSLAKAPVPSLGITGAGRTFERRLMMIVRERTTCRLSALGLCAAALLAVVALPSWTIATSLPEEPQQTGILVAANNLDDDDDTPSTGSKRKVKPKETAPADDDSDDADDDDDDSREKKLKKALGPDFEKKMQKLGEEMSKKFGPGSAFEKKMKALGKDMEKRFGPGSEFETEMKALGKDMEKRFGPGSEFEKEMKALGKDLGPGSDFEKQMKAMREKVKAAKMKAAEARSDASARVKKRTNPVPSSASRAARIKRLEAQIKELSRELKQLKGAPDEEEEDETDSDDQRGVE